MSTSKPGGRSRGGFTLVELMIAITVLLVAVLGTFSSQLRARELIQTTRETAIATADLRAAMERILLRPIDQLPIAGSAFADDQPIAQFEGLHLTDQRIVADYPGYTGGAVPDPLPIVLTMTWTDPRGRPRTETLRSMKTR
ncbi:MAG: prepilin-type N-terminal cleavage/methylation domain-containing protein [Planctomycetes bacterium]|nr:prepilin-type N-terminal cleavage/methylation domain-containing protein [Planctomycetota bacterium]